MISTADFRSAARARRKALAAADPGAAERAATHANAMLDALFGAGGGIEVTGPQDPDVFRGDAAAHDHSAH